MDNPNESERLYKIWARKEFWSIEEACTLAMGKNPKTSNSSNFHLNHSGEPNLVEDYYDLLEDVLKAVQANKIKLTKDMWFELSAFDDNLYRRYGIAPFSFIEWTNINGIQLPSELTKRIYEKNDRLPYDELASLYKKTLSDNEDLKKENKSLKSKDDAKSEIIFALTETQTSNPYQYTQHKNNGAATNVAGLTAQIGLGHKAETTREYLKECEKHCLDEQKRKGIKIT